MPTPAANVPFDLTAQPWELTGWRPQAWRFARTAGPDGFLAPEIGPLPARLPGSVQAALRDGGVIPDWNIGLNSRLVEWVEHRHWCLETTLPPPPAGAAWSLEAEWLDHGGWVLVDGRIVGEFRSPQRPFRLDLPAPPAGGTARLALVFDLPPEEPGQLGRTTEARAFKPRFSFGWDWGVRLVPSGARGYLRLAVAGPTAAELREVAAGLEAGGAAGRVKVRVAGSGSVRTELFDPLGRPVASAGGMLAGEATLDLVVAAPARWWPAGEGDQALYTVRIQAGGRVWERPVGFREVAWKRAPGAPEASLPWVCRVNGRAVFLQGVNWTPLRLDYLSVTPAEVGSRIADYARLGCNVLRVWGGAGRECAAFYEACDRHGLLVWQEFPLCSSGVDSVPPADDAFLAELRAVAGAVVQELRHHACLLLWCGGNELHVTTDGTPGGPRRPVGADHPALRTLAAVVAAEDPGRRFLPTSPWGPRFLADRTEFGRGLHGAVHGPWGRAGFADDAAWDTYWRDDDALFRTECGMPGASDAALILRQAGGEAVWPPTAPLWEHAAGWWSDAARMQAAAGRDGTAEERLGRAVAWSQDTQARLLATALRRCKARFPACGGFLVWMGHDAFPCPANTSLLDFDGRPKPVVTALAAIWRQPAGAS